MTPWWTGFTALSDSGFSWTGARCSSSISLLWPRPLQSGPSPSIVPCFLKPLSLEIKATIVPRGLVPSTLPFPLSAPRGPSLSPRHWQLPLPAALLPGIRRPAASLLPAFAPVARSQSPGTLLSAYSTLRGTCSHQLPLLARNRRLTEWTDLSTSHSKWL